MKTPIQQLLECIPDAEQIKRFILENDADEQMIDQWLWELIYKEKNWEELEKKQIEDAFDNGRDYNLYVNGTHYYEEEIKKKK